MNRRNGGFSVTEMLFTCLILSLTGGLILQTLDLAIRQVRARSADSAAEILCNELAVAVRDQLSYATGVDGADSASEEIAYPAFTSGANGLNGVKCEITALDENDNDTGQVRFRYTKDRQSFDFFPLGDTSAHLKWLTPQEKVEYYYYPGKKAFKVTVTVKDADGYSEEEHKREFEVKPIRNIMLKPNTAPAIKYAIVWRNSKDGTILKASQLEKDKLISPEQPPTPTYSDPEYDYIFDGWNPPLPDGAKVTGNQTYWAQFKEPESKKTYTVTWALEDGTVVKTETLAYGAKPTSPSPDPTKPSDTQYNYQFDGWFSDSGARFEDTATVKGDITYKAKFTPELKKYVVTWRNRLADGSFSTLLTNEATHGDYPQYDGETPTREPSDEYEYRFSGWTPALERVPSSETKDTYTATYTPIKRSYDITWTTENGSVLKTDTFDYGATPSYGDGAPTKASVAKFDYQLKWDPPLHSVNGPETYRATFEATLRKYTITWKNYDGTTFYSQEIEYDKKVLPPETNPTRSETDEDGNSLPYVFSGWDPPVPESGWTVTENQIFTAKYVLQTGSGA